MTTTFDALLRLLSRYKLKIPYIDWIILKDFIETVHNLQHGENSHRIDLAIERCIMNETRFNDWKYDRAEYIEEAKK